MMIIYVKLGHHYLEESMSKIRVMSETLANKIAAGEVIEKCSSIVKELVENSIDAGAKHIKVKLVDGGITEIKITDDGCGMDKDDAVLSFSRHATSKIINDDDLYFIDTFFAKIVIPRSLSRSLLSNTRS